MNDSACRPPGEREAIETVVGALRQQMHDDYPPGRMRRDAHPKMHGCVQAELRVDPELPSDLRVGVLAAPGTTYRAWIRFSNGFKIRPDLQADTRGMAIKLLNVDGETFLGGEHGTQDVVAATHDVFFMPDMIKYVDFPAAAARGFFAVNWFFISHGLWRGLMAAIRSANVPAMNPLAITYFSQTPYSLGPHHVVKFQLRPLLTGSLGRSLPWEPLFRLKSTLVTFVMTLGEIVGLTPLAEAVCARIDEPNFLRRELARSLLASDAWYELLVQRRVGAMPIEDATAAWDSQLSPYQRVAWIRIPRQVFAPAYVSEEPRKTAATEMETLGENISMSPWHALPEHEPVGSINRGRRRAYPASSDFRHESNGLQPKAPSVADFDRLATIVRLAPGSIDPRPASTSTAGRSTLAYLYLRRVPLLTALAFIAFPLASIWSPVALFTSGIFDVKGPALSLVSLLAFLLSFTVMTTWWVVTTYAHQRWRVAKTFGVYPIRRRWYIASAFLALPTMLATVLVPNRPAWGWGRWGWAAWVADWLGGLVAALLLASTGRWLADQLVAVPIVAAVARIWLRHPHLGCGYIDRERGRFLPGHVFALGMAAIVLLLYVTLGRLTLDAVGLPAIAFLLLLALVFCGPLAGATFFFDRFRIPTLTLIALLVFLAHGTRGAQHFFTLLDGPAGVRILEPADVLSAHPPGSPVPRAAVVVSASGGGTQAAVWTARVLTGLQEKCRAMHDSCDPAASIRLISATSGGAVGAMHVIASYDRGHLPSELASIEDHAAQSTQDQLWRDLVYRDIYRPLRALRWTLDYRDRGLALEQAWRQHVGDARLSAWSHDAGLGLRPGAIFNATIAETGQRAPISTAGAVRPGPMDFSGLYPGKDAYAVTAARLSAAFPLVVPFARDGQRIQNVRLVDGGFSDLYGVASATEWLDRALSSNQGGNERIERVLILQLRSPVPQSPVTRWVPDWADQFRRDQEGIEMLRRAWAASVSISSVSLQLCDEPSISWHVTDHQRQVIDEQWKADSDGLAVKAVVDFLTGNGAFALSHAWVDMPSHCGPGA